MPSERKTIIWTINVLFWDILNTYYEILLKLLLQSWSTLIIQIDTNSNIN